MRHLWKLLRQSVKDLSIARDRAATHCGGERLRVLEVMSRLESQGGIGRVALGSAGALVARGHEVHVAGPIENTPLEVGPGVQVHPWPSRSSRTAQLRALLKLQDRVRADVVHFHSALPHGELIAPLRLSRRALGRPPIVLTPHTAARSTYPKLRARLGLYAADAIVPVSHWSARQAVRAGARPERTHVIYPGVHPMPQSACERLPVIVALGRLKPVKGVDVLIEAFDRAAADRPEWRLVIAGEGSARGRLEAQAALAKNSERVELVGPIFGEAKERLLNTAAIGVVPSRFENLPGSLLELQARGLACVAAEVGGIPELARNGAARLVAPGDAAGLASRLGELMDDPELRRDMGRAARDLTASLTWDAVGRELEAVYRGLLDWRGPA